MMNRGSLASATGLLKSRPIAAWRGAAMLMVIGMLAMAVYGCIPESKRHLDRARILFERRDLRDAKLELLAAIKAEPEMLDAHKLLARVDEYLGDEEDAALEYETAARLDPADPKLRYKARFYRQKVQGRLEPSGRADPTPAPAHREIPLSHNFSVGEGEGEGA